jgi:hypothetical protein
MAACDLPALQRPLAVNLRSMCGGHRKFGVKFKAFSQNLADVPTAMEKI